LETNVFGAVWVIQAALPYLREQGAGHIIQMSSIGGSSQCRSAADTTPPGGPSKP